MHKAFLDEVLREVRQHQEAERVKPMITLSRSYGCSATLLAERLAEALNVRERLRGKRVHWQWISKDLFSQLSEVQEEPRKRGSQWSAELMTTLAVREAPPDPETMEAVRNLVETAAETGYCIVVGLAAESILAERPNTLALRLDGGLDWRARQLYEKGHTRSLKAARQLAETRDVQRDAFRRVFQPRDPGVLWHARFDRARVPTGILIDTILGLGEGLGIR